METTTNGPGLWNFFNALAFLILIGLVFTLALYGLSFMSHIAEIKKNWRKYRCDPSIMPFASFYGYNTVENFNYCTGNIFNSLTSDITGSFSSVLGEFTSILTVLMSSVNSLRVGMATLGGGINVIFQDFTDRISTFFFRIRISAIRIKILLQRMYATLFSVLYMGLSGVTATSNFGNTALFGFIDMFCFPPETSVRVFKKGTVPIHQVCIGDLLMPTMTRVTAKFNFLGTGQEMVQLPGGTKVSSNHYLYYDGAQTWIRAIDHPDASRIGPYTGTSLICLNTDTNCIPIGDILFRDYDEIADFSVDKGVMTQIERIVNGGDQLNCTKNYIGEYAPSLARNTFVLLSDGSSTQIRNIRLGTTLSTGGKVIGMEQKEIYEFCILPGSVYVGSATMIWRTANASWIRAGDLYPIHKFRTPVVFCSLFVAPNSQIELANGIRIRDCMELCSPVSEEAYANKLADEKLRM
jgi:hypothetical protein